METPTDATDQVDIDESPAPGDDADELATLRAENEALKAENADLKSARDKANRRARAAEKSAPDKARKVGPMKGSDADGYVRPSSAELRELLKDAETVEVVLSNGHEEILGAGPFSIEGDAPWEDTPAGLKLNVPDMTVHGPGLGSKQAVSIEGYGLLVDGKQVAWAPRFDGGLSVGPGQTYQLKDDVVF